MPTLPLSRFRFAAVVLASALASAALIGASLTGVGNAEPQTSASSVPPRGDGPFAGISQRGPTLGSGNAGKLRIVIRGLAFIGPDSEHALRAVVAAGAQDHLWDVVHGLYANQGAENTGWVGDHLLRAIADETPGLDAERLLRERDAGWVDQQIARDAAEANREGVSGTPAFAVGPTGGRLERVTVTSLGLEGIRPAIKELLAR